MTKDKVGLGAGDECPGAFQIPGCDGTGGLSAGWGSEEVSRNLQTRQEVRSGCKDWCVGGNRSSGIRCIAGQRLEPTPTPALLSPPQTAFLL